MSWDSVYTLITVTFIIAAGTVAMILELGLLATLLLVGLTTLACLYFL